MTHPIINARPDAPDGFVHHLHRYGVRDFPATSAILCRNNAPLIEFAFSLLTRSIACHIVGRDLQVGLEKLIDSIGGLTISEFEFNLRKQRDKALDRAKSKQQADNINDKYRALLVIAKGCGNADAIKVKLATIFRDGPGITLSTIHRAKGLEWDTVFLLDWSLLPSYCAETRAEKQQEKNLQYIAITRARSTLFFIDSGKWATEK